ncbi:MAG: DUF167 domain-containing protein [Alphaproteobacteria bacterium]|nr:DUF167 domain-containing protein [Alphaproteobacteria bacterium]
MSDENALDKHVRTQENGVSFYVKITPQAPQNKIGLWCQASDDSWFLKIMIKATPEKGKANQTLIQFLAKTFKIRQSAISILHGNTDRMKLLLIEGDSLILKDLLGRYK